LPWPENGSRAIYLEGTLLLNMDAENLAFPDNSFDFVLVLGSSIT